MIWRREKPSLSCLGHFQFSVFQEEGAENGRLADRRSRYRLSYGNTRSERGSRKLTMNRSQLRLDDLIAQRVAHQFCGGVTA
jgi:hypothetical protein